MFDTGYTMLGPGARGRSREMIWGGRWEGGSGLGTHVHPWQIHVNVWQNQYSIVKQNQVKKKIKKKPFKVDNVNLLVCNLPCIIYNKRFANNAQNSPSQASAIREP